MTFKLKNFFLSWQCREGSVNSTEEIISWINERNRTVNVELNKIPLSSSGFWFYDEKTGQITNKNRTFFRITGIRYSCDKSAPIEQPIIIQDEIGYLGIICKKINGVINFLMQAKIEPGNVNKVQLSPTIQATKSNFLRVHGGAAPPYLDYFVNAQKHEIIVDQIQSEQASRFLKKRNRNMLILVSDDVEVLPSHKWMTLGQIKELMKSDNIINMDARTVISCIPFSLIDDVDAKQIISELNNPMIKSILSGNKRHNALLSAFHEINGYKMMSAAKYELIDLFSLKDWEMSGNEFVCKNGFPFKVVFCDISIDGREVARWSQPLLEATGKALFGLFMAEIDGRFKFLVKLKPEAGSFDNLELGPTVQLEATELDSDNTVDRLFIRKWKAGEGVVHDVIMSEEGGRFYHEQNDNVIIKIPPSDIKQLPSDYFWLDFYTLNSLIQFGGYLNIQLRNLISLLELDYEN